MSASGFYHAFEDRHRGSRELITERLKVYLPFISPLPALYQPARGIDLGCGRGEWLEMLQHQGFAPHGVDLDASMLAVCSERGLAVSQTDVLAYLQTLADDSLAVVTAFHVVEHISFDQLQILVAESHRVLKPGGLLIMETPNPENISVATCNFYLDPTHQRPIPALLLSFLSEYHGYARVKTLRLQESSELRAREDIGLLDVLEGVSPDYAVVAQKAAAPEIMSAFDEAFNRDYGLSLPELAQRYDRARHRPATALERVTELQDRLLDVTAQLARLESEALFVSEKQKETRRHAEAANARLHDLQQRFTELEAERNSLRQSWSWRITSPLRGVASVLASPSRSLYEPARSIARRGIGVAQRSLGRVIAVVLRNPRRSDQINRWLEKNLPALHSQLRTAWLTQRAAPGASSDSEFSQSTGPMELEHLPPRALEIYKGLNKSLKKHHERKNEDSD